MKEISFSSNADFPCHVCAAPAIAPVPGYELLRRVTSDCRPWRRGGHLYVCPGCGCVQKMTDPTWQADTEKIYEAYSIYHQSGGVEQAVFEESSGQSSSRSARLMERLLSCLQLPSTGRLLDVGCGNGGLLNTFSKRAPLWSLVGTELSDKYKSIVEKINGVEALYTDMPDQVPGSFDAITMVHVLEHILRPEEFLIKLRDKLNDGGLLVIEVPDYKQNPFDLLIEDHCTHFTSETLMALTKRAGYEVAVVATDWVPKELTVVARKSNGQYSSTAKVPISDLQGSAISSVQWLKAVVSVARELSMSGSFGLFGTSIAGTWLFSELEETVNFFVDEDPHRVGKTYMGRPIYHPQQVPDASQVFIALPPKLAESISRRVAKPGITYHVPPLDI